MCIVCCSLQLDTEVRLKKAHTHLVQDATQAVADCVSMQAQHLQTGRQQYQTFWL